ncbi:hypothetical protein FSW04_17905 [Baekduia soli]|uniref:Uncharacterized protein n=2 Tax=Baekduia soli TaxID=496014 RepID=A0A5B8U8I7_9ACTN|nr:hypothetical protein FSW04_17905 [Baekduia soli]
MLTHAEHIKSLIVAPAPDPADGFDGGTRREHPRGPNSRDAVAAFAKRDPRGFNAAVERGDIDLAKVR